MLWSVAANALVSSRARERRRADRDAQDEPGYDQAETAADLERLLASLSERERTILRLRFEEDLRTAITTCSSQPAAR